ncbi:MAG: aspartate/glutamate racemase family protein, partial [Boseongicola sp.]|nr:aspartate/glutamate racemase family protein [Boseongicola sp.]
DPTLLLDLFVDAAHELIALGCDGLTKNCGFLELIQDELAKRVPVPVAVSSLMQIPSVQKMLPSDKRVGVITISAESLTDAHLRAAGVDDPSQVPVVGTDAGRAFTHGILDDQPTIDYDACKLDLADAASDLMAKAPDVGAIVLECTNMVPYAADIRKQTGLPVYSIYSLVTWFQQGLLPRKFPFELDDPR